MKTLIKDQNGEEIEAFRIFVLAIKYLKDQAIGRFRTLVHRNEYELMEKNIYYVITVPAIWDDQAKLFMRRAAEQVCKSMRLMLSSLNLKLS